MKYILEFNLHTFWRIGTGRGTGAGLDEICCRDNDLLPIIPGRTVKGLLRDSMQRLEAWGQIQPGTTDRLFGSRTGTRKDFADDDDAGNLNKNVTTVGQIRVSSARLAGELRKYLQWLRREQTDAFHLLAQQLFTTLHSTALEDGVAKETSLRIMEVAIPMKLYSDFAIHNPAEGDIEAITSGLSLLRSLGASRNRGLGRVTVTLQEQDMKEENHAG